MNIQFCEMSDIINEGGDCVEDVKFYSEKDNAFRWEIDKILKIIKNQDIERAWSVNDMIIFYNISKYLSFKQFADYINDKIDIDIVLYEKNIKKKLGQFIGINKNKFIDLYDEDNFLMTDDFLEIIEKFEIYKDITTDGFKKFLCKEHVHVHFVLKHKKIVEFFNALVKEAILSDPRNAELIISIYLKESDSNIPRNISEKELLGLIEEYIDSEFVNLNVLKRIVTFPNGKGISISDKIKLHAKRKAEVEEEKIFSNGICLETGISISYPDQQNEVIICYKLGRSIDLKISRSWIKDNLDYPTLWNNFIYLFNFVDDKFCLEFDSKKSEISTPESVLFHSGDYLYNTSYAFTKKEMISNAEIYSYIQVLSVVGIRFEDMIEWFFHKYIKEEFTILDFAVKLPSEETSYFEKCRTILPEIDRIFKQYDLLVEDGSIDQELIQMSSSSVKVKDIKSFVKSKYVYPSSDWFKTSTYLLFSDQSGIFYLPEKGKEFNNFFDLISKCDLSKNEFKEYQIREIQWLFDSNLIFEDANGYLKFVEIKLIYILSELYHNEVINFWHYPEDIRKRINFLVEQEYVCFESSLLSRNEQDYFDFYLNKAKFTNGHDIRNRYLHGTNSNDERQYKADYYTILKIIVIIIIKINDDLCIKQIIDEFISTKSE